MPPTAPSQFSGIFVSYRRDDCAGHAGRLSDKLSAHFGKDQIFMDIDNIQPGEDFVQVIENAVGSCDILIAIIGRHWLSSVGDASRPLDNANDFVRLEIAAALNRDIRVIPVLVQGAMMPKPQDLPDDLSKLSRRHALELTDTRWQRDVDQLVNAIEKILEQSRRRPFGGLTPPTPRKRMLPIVAGAFIVVMVIAAVLFNWNSERATQQLGSATPNTFSGTNASPAEKVKLVPPVGMVYVPGGEFMMGRNKGDGGDEYEHPAHKITVKPFFIDAHEVTCEEYKKFLDANPDQATPPGWVNRSYPAGAAAKPVTGVDWDQASAYATWSDKRLPFEEEWEFAARGTDGRRYPWGKDWQPRMANANGAATGLSDVGAFKGASPYGAVDMAGNAWEWTASRLVAYPGGGFQEQRSGDLRVIRGGSYDENANEAMTTYRGFLKARGDKYDKTGFRCAKDAGDRIGV